MTVKIVHITTVHPRTDTRIRVKEGRTLARELDADVRLYVQDGLGDECDAESSLHIVDTGPAPARRIARMTEGAWRMYRAVRRLQPDVVHYHDPELIPVGFLLKASGLKVVYDVHEDAPRQVLSKDYIPYPVRRVLSTIVYILESLAARRLDGIIAATPVIAENFPKSKRTLVQNFPLRDELTSASTMDYASRAPHFAYIGAITRIRGIADMVEALNKHPSESVRLQLAGRFASPALQAEIAATAGWKKVTFVGWVDRSAVARILGSVRAGLVLFHPLPNHTSAQPNKLFEYMAAGLPLIASDFPLWREIVEGAGAGLLVDPENPDAIANAMRWILENPVAAEAMGRRGQIAIQERFNWDQEGARLVGFYQRLLNLAPVSST